MFTAAVKFATYGLLQEAGIAQRYDDYSWQPGTVVCFGSEASTLSSVCYTERVRGPLSPPDSVYRGHIYCG